ncbi:REST corepressor 3-like isoform X1 [Lethenteron reissneri]|uniref:REST corepressor 3-like isoform X1 n=1 Tax=Lethenteron reissneri TaxID=7753 RepID=UPI002AB6AFD9|nr:REST corepressor 3-like isoform X1 [Lethenteron reissneri]
MPIMMERGSESVRGGGRASGTKSPSGAAAAAAAAAAANGHHSEESSSSEDERAGGGIRVGSSYQVVIPPFNPGAMQCEAAEREREREHAGMLVWSPNHNIPEPRLDEYIAIAKEKYGYNMEQALGMLFWHKHNIEKSLADLPNFTPFPDEWTVEDKVLFEQAFSFHGKSFHRIQQMLPDKSIGSLVRYYYAWKKTRTRTSVMDRQARKLAGKREHDESDESDDGNRAEGREGDAEAKKEPKKEVVQVDGRVVGQPPPKPMEPPVQQPSRAGPIRREGQGPQHRHHMLRNKRRPPRGMFLSWDDLVVVSACPTAASTVLRQLDMEIVSLKRQVQSAKQQSGSLKQMLDGGISAFRPTESNPRVSVRWSTEEQLLAVQGIRRYGRDFQAIADVLGTKTVAQIRNFFVSYRRRFNLEEVLQEWEAEQGVTGGGAGVGGTSGGGGVASGDGDSSCKSSSNASSGKNSDDENDEVQPMDVSHAAAAVTTEHPGSGSLLHPPPPLLRPPLPSSAPPLHRQPPPLQPQRPGPGAVLARPATQPPPLIRPAPGAPPRLNPRPPGSALAQLPSLVQGGGGVGGGSTSDAGTPSSH